MDAFDLLTTAITKIPKNQKIVLFFDELPWIATKKSGAITALEYFWNRYWSNNAQIKLIVCGSAASWIIKKIIKNRGGLHNRITRKIKLSPFNLQETYAYLQHIKYICSYQQVVKLYMVMGGVPFYLKNLNRNYSIDQNIEKLFFNANGILFDEFNEVFSSLFENEEQYKEIIIFLANHKNGIQRSIIEQNNKLTGKGGNLTKRLQDLEYAGFIASYIPFGHKKMGIFYRLNDEYCLFYLKWIQPIKNKLQQGLIAKYWKRIVDTPEYFSWLGYSFESICYKHINKLKQALKIDESSVASPWRYIPKKGSLERGEQGAQIDLLFERDDDAITICEIKYTEQPFAIDKQYAHNLTRKIAVFRKITRINKQIFIVMISANGLKKTIYSEEIINNIITLEDLFY